LPITEFPPYQYPIQDYGFWYSNMGQNGLVNEENDTESKLSRVKAFTNDPNFQVPETTEITGQNNSRVLLKKERIETTDLSQYDLIITSERVLSEQQNHNIKYWNSFYSRDQNSYYPTITFVESLQVVQNQIESGNFKKVAITPVGFEDETLYLNEFLENLKKDFELHIYFHRPLDFISLTAPDSI
jgi:hypothetical protein